jgi:hypothetical protein
MNFYVVHVTSEMPSYIEKQKRKSILINDKSLYGLKTYAARFHGHLSESLLRLGFKKTKHDPD